MNVRPATPADAEGIARVHVDSWRTTYQGIVPAEFLASLSLERRTEQWQSALDQYADSNWIYVACTDQSEIVGFLSCGPMREELGDFQAEIFAIYLLEAWQKRGLGRKLFERALVELNARGYESMLLWVLKDNPATRFYERMGGKRMGEKTLDIGGVPLTEIAYGWHSLS